MKSSDSEKKKLKAKACYVPNNNDQVDVPTDNTINPFDNDVMKKLSYFDIIQVKLHTFIGKILTEMQLKKFVFVFLLDCYYVFDNSADTSSYVINVLSDFVADWSYSGIWNFRGGQNQTIERMEKVK